MFIFSSIRERISKDQEICSIYRDFGVFHLSSFNCKHILETQDSSDFLWVRGLMVSNVGFEFCDRSSIPIVCQITDDDHRKLVYIVPYSLDGGLLLDQQCY